jgi:glycosyltransferase involved in cell wall biosynthesis
MKLGLLALDIGLAPLQDTEFNRGKSNLKVLEYGVMGVPTIASPVYPYSNTIDNGVDGIIVHKNRTKSWVKALVHLIDNKEDRIRMGEAMKGKVLTEYNALRNAHLWEKAYGLTE